MKKRKNKEIEVRFRRKKTFKLQSEKILLICGGKVTEPAYFNNLKKCLGIQFVKIVVRPSKRSSPGNVFSEAETLYFRELDTGDSFDRVYCIFDRDDFPDFEEAVKQIRSTEQKETFFAITSAPCFEYWFLLHFKFTTKPYKSTNKKSAASHLIDDLKAEWPEYQKNLKNSFERLESKLDFAIDNAQRSITNLKQNGSDSSYTYVFELVNYLMEFRDT